MSWAVMAAPVYRAGAFRPGSWGGRVARGNVTIPRVPRAKLKACPCLLMFLNGIPQDARCHKSGIFFPEDTLLIIH
jgi:hypothetical protein